METKLKRTGFTLIELLVVIVIIGILSTISVGTFKSYFGKGRDAARVSAVQALGLMIKVQYADDWTADKYVFTGVGTGSATDNDGTLYGMFNANDYKVPKAENDRCYYIAVGKGVDAAAGGDNQFFVAVSGETRSTDSPTVVGLIYEGTKATIDVLEPLFDGTTTAKTLTCSTPIATGMSTVLGSDSDYFVLNATGAASDAS